MTPRPPNNVAMNYAGAALAAVRLVLFEFHFAGLISVLIDIHYYQKYRSRQKILEELLSMNGLTNRHFFLPCSGIVYLFVQSEGGGPSDQDKLVENPETEPLLRISSVSYSRENNGLD